MIWILAVFAVGAFLGMRRLSVGAASALALFQWPLVAVTWSPSWVGERDVVVGGILAVSALATAGLRSTISPRSTGFLRRLRRVGIAWSPFFILTLVALANSPDVDSAWAKFAAFWGRVLFLPIGFFAAAEDFDSGRGWSTFLLFGIALLAVIVFSSDDPTVRLESYGINPIWIGRQAAIVALVGVLALSPSPALRVLAIATGAIVLAFTGSRAPAIAALAALAVTPFLSASFGWQRRLRSMPRVRLLMLVALAAVVTTIVLSQVGLFQEGKERMLSAATGSNAGDDRTLNIRIQLWTDVFSNFETSLFGAGLMSASMAHGQHVHNLILEILFDTGGVGLLAFLWGIVIGLKSARSATPILAIAISLLASSMTSGDLASNAWAGAALTVAILVAPSARSANAVRPRPVTQRHLSLRTLPPPRRFRDQVSSGAAR